jgi:hypothetical protein|tara:strand:- start:33024 stop:33440 length:417 start_codon:yes stop_codon:yes gene_type:complete
MDCKTLIKKNIFFVIIIGVLLVFVIVNIYSYDSNYRKGDDTITQYKNYEFEGLVDTIYLNSSKRYQPYLKLIDSDSKRDYPVPVKMFKEKLYKKGDKVIKVKGDSIIKLKSNDEKLIQTYDYLLRIKQKRSIENYLDL